MTDKLVRVAERLLDFVAVVAFLAMFMLILVQIALRYIFNAPLVWSDEAAQYCFVWVAFIGVVRAARHGSHIRIGTLVERLPHRWRNALAFASNLVGLVFAGILCWYGFKLIEQNYTVSMTSIPLPYWIVYAIVPGSALFLMVYAFRDSLTSFRDAVFKRERHE